MVMIFGVTALGLIYVHQQVELLKLSYAIDYKEKKLEQILDRKESLGYNIKELENPSRLENVLHAKRVTIAFPKKGQIIRIASAPIRMKTEEALKSAAVETKSGAMRIFEFLGLRAEAQAKER
jgi:hypothetical protein